MRTFVLILVFIPSITHCGFEQTSIGPRARGLAGANAALSGEATGIFLNPAGLASIVRPEGSFMCTPAQYGFTELRLLAAGVAIPIATVALGLGVRTFGYEVYRETSVSLSCACTYSVLSIGARVNYHFLSIQSYGSGGALALDLGMQGKITDQVYMGFIADDVSSSTIGESHERIPQRFTTGVLYRAIESMLLIADYQIQPGFDPSPRFGIEYAIVPVCAIRAGVARQPSLYSAGIGVRLSPLKFDYAISQHEELGPTHEFALTISWGSRP